MLFPVGMAGRPGAYTAVGTEIVADRLAYIVEWKPDFASNRLDTFWVDSQTGVVLRWQNYAKPDGAELTAETTILQIQYNLQFPDAMFQIERPLPGKFASGPYDS